MRIIFNPKTKEAQTKVENIKDSQHRKQHETTALYLAAKLLMQMLADETGSVLSYKILTENEKIRDWARSTGVQIFNWQEVDVIHQESYPNLYVFNTTVEPKEGNSIMDINSQ